MSSSYRQSLTLARRFVVEQGGEIAPLSVSEEELNPDVQQDEATKAYPIEATTSPIKVQYAYPQDSLCSEFRFFEDGRQRTIQIAHIPTEYGSHLLMVPVHYFVVSAVILERVGRQLQLWGEPMIRKGVMVARSLIPNQEILAQIEAAGLLVEDTESKTVGSNDYYDLRRRALRRAKSLRLQYEQELISQWRESKESEDAFLVVDGTLMNMRDEKNVARCVGISKSFGSRYFDVTTHNRIMRLQEFERSWAFRFHADTSEDDPRLGVRERVSWYLRLRQGINVDPEFGLVRVEISKDYADNVGEFANRFSRSLLSDRLPTSYPAPRWDKHLYPIRECENYLGSIMAGISTITASMCG